MAAWKSVGCRRGLGSGDRGGYVLVGASVGLFVRTAIRNTDWHDNITLAIATGRDNPRSAKACYWAGSVLANQGPLPWMTEFGAQIAGAFFGAVPDVFGRAIGNWRSIGQKKELGRSTINLAHAA